MGAEDCEAGKLQGSFVHDESWLTLAAAADDKLDEKNEQQNFDDDTKLTDLCKMTMWTEGDSDADPDCRVGPSKARSSGSKDEQCKAEFMHDQSKKKGKREVKNHNRKQAHIHRLEELNDLMLSLRLKAANTFKPSPYGAATD